MNKKVTPIRGRPPIDFGDDKVYDLAVIGCTYSEIAAILHCSISTLERRFRETINEGRANMNQSLRMKQLQLANDGNTALLIHLGKSNLGQHEKKEITVDGSVDNKIQIEFLSPNLIVQNIIDVERSDHDDVERLAYDDDERLAYGDDDE